jgi:hypothetical protein
VIRRPLKSGNLVLQPGDPIAHAERWLRVDAWVRARKIELIP